MVYVDAAACLHIVYVDAVACLHIVQVILYLVKLSVLSKLRQCAQDLATSINGSGDALKTSGLCHIEIFTFLLQFKYFSLVKYTIIVCFEGYVSLRL